MVAKPGATSRSRAGRLRLGGSRRRLRVIGIVLAVVFTLFTGRLVQLQAVDASEYGAKIAKSENRFTKVKLPAERGAIVDRHGDVLADTVDGYDITADPLMFTPDKAKVSDAPERAARLLAPVLGVSQKTLVKKLKKDSRWVRLARQQSPRTWKHIKKMQDKQEEKASAQDGHGVLAGVFHERHSKRVYPGRELASGVLGFVNGKGEGSAGLESAYDKQLAGTDGERSYVQVNGRRVPTAEGHEKSPEPGRDLRLTLDRDLQWKAQREITKQVRRTEAKSGTVVAMDARTGKVLSMASAPGYDPNKPASVPRQRIGSPALQNVFEPGSTSKVMSLAAVLEEQAATPKTHVTVPGALHRADRIFHDDVPHDTWHLTLNGVLAKSSNIGTILATEQLGDKRSTVNKALYRYLKRFGLGAPSGLHFPGEASGILAKPGEWNASQQYTIPFGQGLSMNALQATSVYQTIANKGVRVAPRLVRDSTGSDGHLTSADPPKKTRVVSEHTAQQLSKMLESVVGSDGGTGADARIDGYRVAGKTGTANRVDPKTGRYRGYTASFIGFAPADKPRVVVSCVLQDPKKHGHFGGPLCGPVFKKVTEFALASMQAAPSGKSAPKPALEW